MYKVAILTAIATIHLGVSQSAFSQIRINLPKMPKVEKPKTDTGNTTMVANRQGSPKNSDGKNLYSGMEPTSTRAVGRRLQRREWRESEILQSGQNRERIPIKG